MAKVHTRGCTRAWLLHDQRMMWSGLRRIVQGGGSRLPFQRASRRSRRRSVRLGDLDEDRPAGWAEPDQEIGAVGQQAADGAVLPFCGPCGLGHERGHVSHEGRSCHPIRSVKERVNLGVRKAEPGCEGRATVLFPDPDAPATRTRRGELGKASSGPRKRRSSTCHLPQLVSAGGPDRTRQPSKGVGIAPLLSVCQARKRRLSAAFWLIARCRMIAADEERRARSHSDPVGTTSLQPRGVRHHRQRSGLESDRACIPSASDRGLGRVVDTISL